MNHSPLHDSVVDIPGIGPKTAELLAAKQIFTLQDLLLFVPLRYEDRSERKTIAQLWADNTLFGSKQLFTLLATVKSAKSVYLRGRSLQSAVVFDETGELNITWFNNPYIVKRLKTGEQFLFSGPVKQMGKKLFMTQPLVEVEGTDTIHTDRLVPIYSSSLGIQPTVLRRVLKAAADMIPRQQADPISLHFPELLSLTKALQQLHFPDASDQIIHARMRLAVEELISLILKSQAIKETWKADRKAVAFTPQSGKKTQRKIKGAKTETIASLIPPTFPYELTDSQSRSLQEILADLTSTTPMNRLLLGDVGSGKTIVAAVALQQAIANHTHAALIAPTQILAEQHAKNLQILFPSLSIQLLTGKTKRQTPVKKTTKRANAGKLQPATTSTTAVQADTATPTLFIGTHAVLNFFHSQPLRPPVGLVVFDEQHRFGVNQRSMLQELRPHPHILTMTATPIPRSLMLTIFSHLSLSTIDELPKNRLPTKTWLAPESKRQAMLNWIADQSHRASLNSDSSAVKPQSFLTLYICPFIDPSSAEALENIASAKKKFEDLQAFFAAKHAQLHSKEKDTSTPLKLALLHGRQTVKEKTRIIEQLYAGQIDILVTTPIVEVGIDLPQASAIVIEAAERFGLASLHQLRGRVGRAGQQGYCVLLSPTKNPATLDRLHQFEQLHNGQQLAELDLKNRGAGNLFGVEQHGFDELRFASWTDLEAIKIAKHIADQIRQKSMLYQPLFTFQNTRNLTPLAN